MVLRARLAVRVPSRCVITYAGDAYRRKGRESRRHVLLRAGRSSQAAVVEAVAVNPSSPRPQRQADSTATAESVPVEGASADPAQLEAGSRRLSVTQRNRIAAQARDAAAGIRRWDAEVAACTGPSGDQDDASATCTHGAWQRLLLNMEVAQYYLLELTRHLRRGGCHAQLATALDAVHGFISGAAPIDTAWLDDQQQPPSRYDLESVVELGRQVPDRMQHAVASACAP